jgi:hypothetical protein
MSHVPNMDVEAAATIEMMGKLAAFQLLLRGIIKPIVATKLVAAQWCADQTAAMISSLRPLASARDVPPGLLRHIENQINFTMANAAS